MVNARRQLPRVNVAVNTNYQTEFQGSPVKGFGLSIQGDYTATSGTGVPANESCYGFMGPIELVQGEEPLVQMHGRDFRHLTSMIAGGYFPLAPTLVLNASDKFFGRGYLPFEAFMPGAAIDASQDKIVLRGRFGSLTDFGSDATAVTGSLRPYVATTKTVEGNFFEPRFLQQQVRIDTSSTDIQAVKRIQRRREYLAGILFRQFDASAEFSNANLARVDGLVRNLRLDLERGGDSKEVFRHTWGELKFEQQATFGLSRGDMHTGVALYLFDDPETPEIQETLILEPGDALTLHVDTNSTIEEEFTAVTPATGDTLFVTFLSYVGRGPKLEEAERNGTRRAIAARRAASGR